MRHNLNHALMAPPLDPSRLWTLSSEGREASCELVLTPDGKNQIWILRNGNLQLSRLFDSSEEALTWAEEERNRLLTPGGRAHLRLVVTNRRPD